METATDKDIGVSGSYSWHLLFFAKLIIYHEIEGKRRENLTWPPKISCDGGSRWRWLHPRIHALSM